MNNTSSVYVPNGRKKIKLMCQHCDLEMIFDKRKREKKYPKMLKHIKEKHLAK